MKLQVLYESFVVGIATLIIGSLFRLTMNVFMGIDKPIKGEAWNKYYMDEVCLFLTGVTIHLGCEILGINKWYCSNGAACLAF